MRGIVFTGEKAELTTDLEVRAPGPTEVKVRIAAAGLCHSDLSVIDGTIPYPTPVVLGHEAAGIVEEVGASVRSLRAGDPVVLHTLANCGLCPACSTGHPTRCRETLGNLSQPFTVAGEPAYNFAACSAFAEFTVVRETQAVRIDPSIPLTSACLIGCGVLTGAGAVLNRARVAPGQTAAVFGVGGVGLNVIQGLVLADAGRIVAVDTLASKEAIARTFGATDFVDASAGSAADAIRELFPFSSDLTSGPAGAGGVDWSFECVGNPAVLDEAVRALDWGGSCVVLGVPSAAATTEVQLTHLVHVDRAILGCRYGSARPHHDIPLFARHYQAGRLKLDELITRTYTLDEFEIAVADLRDGKLARGVFTMT